MKNQPRIIDLVREWWKSHPELHKVKTHHQRVARAGSFEIRLDHPWVENPAFGFWCTCCDIWWIVIRDGRMSWAYYREASPMRQEPLGLIEEPNFFAKIELALKTIYHPTS